MVIQFGYATLFSCSFTLAPVMAYVNNYVELRVDAWKICTQSRRPLPGGAEDIGTWQSVLELMSILAITTNLGIVCFTSEKLVKAPRSFRVIWFILIEHFAVGAKVVAAAVIPDCPDEVAIQLARQELIIDKIINGAKDELSDIIEYQKDNVSAQIERRLAKYLATINRHCPRLRPSTYHTDPSFRSMPSRSRPNRRVLKRRTTQSRRSSLSSRSTRRTASGRRRSAPRQSSTMETEVPLGLLRRRAPRPRVTRPRRGPTGRWV